jgi:hypothetical protein
MTFAAASACCTDVEKEGIPLALKVMLWSHELPHRVANTCSKGNIVIRGHKSMPSSHHRLKQHEETTMLENSRHKDVSLP